MHKMTVMSCIQKENHVDKFHNQQMTQRFITVFTRAHHTCPIQSTTPSLVSWRSTVILSYHLFLCIPNGLLTSGPPTKTLPALLLSPICATCPIQFILAWSPKYVVRSSSLCNFRHSPVTSFLLGLNIFLSTLLTNILGLLSSFNLKDQVSDPYKTTVKIIEPYILITILFYNRLKEKRFWTVQ
jgi:hypothetical protein